jgi:hypothetical protein
MSDEELDRLRQRAAESGVTVSAYMRSCVLEAEMLRAQVKQALAEIRGQAAISAAAPAMPAVQATPRTAQPSTIKVSDEAERGFPRLFAKTAALLMGSRMHANGQA